MTRTLAALLLLSAIGTSAQDNRKPTISSRLTDSEVKIRAQRQSAVDAAREQLSEAESLRTQQDYLIREKHREQEGIPNESFCGTNGSNFLNYVSPQATSPQSMYYASAIDGQWIVFTLTPKGECHAL